MKIKRFKLNVLSAESLQQKEMNAIVGGYSCGCSCAYADRGGSSISANRDANYAYDTTSTYGCNQFSKDDEYGYGVLIQPRA